MRFDGYNTDINSQTEKFTKFIVYCSEIKDKYFIIKKCISTYLLITIQIIFAVQFFLITISCQYIYIYINSFLHFCSC